MLVIATSVQVVLLAVTFEGGDPAKKMTLRPTHVEYPTDGVGMIQVRWRCASSWSLAIGLIRVRSVCGGVQIVGSTKGRIFLGGTDGCVYELVYHEERSVLQYVIPTMPCAARDGTDGSLTAAGTAPQVLDKLSPQDTQDQLDGFAVRVRACWHSAP